MKPMSQVSNSSPRVTTGWLASRASRRSQDRTNRPLAVYTRSTNRSTTLMNPTRPRGMTRVTATFTHTAATIRTPRTAAAMRTPLMLVSGPASAVPRPPGRAGLFHQIVASHMEERATLEGIANARADLDRVRSRYLPPPREEHFIWKPARCAGLVLPDPGAVKGLLPIDEDSRVAGLAADVAEGTHDDDGTPGEGDPDRYVRESLVVGHERSVLPEPRIGRGSARVERRGGHRQGDAAVELPGGCQTARRRPVEEAPVGSIGGHVRPGGGCGCQQPASGKRLVIKHR